MSSYLSVLTSPFNLNKSKYHGMGKTKSYCMSQYVLYNTLGMGQYPGPVDFPYLNRVRGSRLGVSLLPPISDIGANRFVGRTGRRAVRFNYGANSHEGRAAAAFNAIPGVVPIPLAMTQAEIDALPWAGPSAVAPEPQPTSKDVRIFTSPVCSQNLGIRSNLGRITRTPKGLEHRELNAVEVSVADFNFPELHSLLGEGGGGAGYMGRFIKLGG